MQHAPQITVTELIKAHTSKSSSALHKRLQLGNWAVPPWVVNTYKHVGFFAFGAVVCQLTTDIGKYSIGRLRPHFFAVSICMDKSDITVMLEIQTGAFTYALQVCQPLMNDGTTCAEASNAGRYITDFTCRGLGSSARMLKEVRLSFPSGHSSFATYTMIYTAVSVRNNCQHDRIDRIAVD